MALRIAGRRRYDDDDDDADDDDDGDNDEALGSVRARKDRPAVGIDTYPTAATESAAFKF